ncbi:MAG TPA: cytochrome c family protein [Polyangia bacterium]|nr:cytochrome c family protein [Polyangia bacterium]
MSPPLPARPSPAPAALAATLLLAALAWAAVGRAAGPAPRAAERRFTLFYTAEAHGTLEPCGCTSDPLGDVARYASVVRAARKTNDVLLVDAGGLSYPEGGASPRERAGNDLRAKFLASELGKLGLAAAGLADTDLAAGPSAVTPPRLAANLPKAPELAPAPSVLRTVGGVRVGVLGVVDPSVASTLGVRAEDPAAAARREAANLRKAGAEIVVALAPVDRAVARRLARAAAVDFVVLGRQVGDGSPRADAVDHEAGVGDAQHARAFILTPADELQRVGRVDVTLRGQGALVDAGGPEATDLRQAELRRDLARVDGELASWSRPGCCMGADPSFIAAKKKERDALAEESARLGAAPWTPPAAGSYFTNRLIPLSRALPRDPAIASAMHALDAQIGKVNLAAAAPPPPAEPGRPFYVGMDKCASCHKPAVAFWRTTVHAHAWKTLVDGGKQADYKCVGCHVTGYGQVGGTSLGHTKGFENIQCETCHGPGSEHVAAKGLEDPPAIQRQTPSPVCTNCHNEHHSDTFNYNAYLRDILGPGHAASARERMGDGPTGHSLRSAALAKAKAAGKATLRKL